MSLEKLSERAKEAILKVSPRKKVKSGEILRVLSASSGMSSVLLQLFPKMKVNKDVDIHIDVLVKEAFYQAVKMEHPYVGTEHLLLALLKLTSSSYLGSAREELAKMNVFPHAVKSIEKGSKTPILEAFGENLNNKLFREFDKPLVVREEYNSLVSALLQKNSANPLLVGEKGVGKNSIIELLSQNINLLNVPPSLVGYQVIEFDLLAFMTNAFNKNSLETVLASFMEELKSVERVILSIKNFQNIFFATSTGFTVPVFYSMFKSSLEAVDVRFIATMSTPLYEKIIAENEHILDSVSVIEVAEPKEDLTKEILRLNAMYLGKFHNVEISSPVINYVYKKAKEEIKDVKFPQKGLDLLDQACSRLIMKKRVVPDSYKDLVDKTFSIVQSLDRSIEKGDYETAMKSRKKLGKMESNLLEEEQQIFQGKKLKLTSKEVDEALRDFGIEKRFSGADLDTGSMSGLSKNIKKKIIGQDEAVDTVVKSLIRARLGLRPRKRPLGNFLFLGPTGVGKTELAKVLADSAFGHGENALIRLDMSDFAEKHNVARLVGAPPGYVGYGEGGELTQKIELQPESVVLFDEIEKAHPDVLNILLQIMEEGELTDAKGNTFDFSKAIIILTSNIGTEFIHSPGIGFEEKAVEDSKLEGRLKANLKKILKPELINRFDEVIVFRRLSKDDQMNVLDLLIEEVSASLGNQKVNLRIIPAAKRQLLTQGYSAEYGARGLRRVVEKELLDKIAEVLLKNKRRPLALEVKTRKGNLAVSPTKSTGKK
jgi:ATP-dependent Clp protease ATP-binding subunit ClpC